MKSQRNEEFIFPRKHRAYINNVRKYWGCGRLAEKPLTINAGHLFENIITDGQITDELNVVNINTSR